MLHRRPWGAMADSGDTGLDKAGLDEAARLEAALARIARARPQAGAANRPAPTQPNPDRQALAARLDALISDLRAALGGHSAD